MNTKCDGGLFSKCEAIHNDTICQPDNWYRCKDQFIDDNISCIEMKKDFQRYRSIMISDVIFWVLDWVVFGVLLVVTLKSRPYLQLNPSLPDLQYDEGLKVPLNPTDETNSFQPPLEDGVQESSPVSSFPSKLPSHTLRPVNPSPPNPRPANASPPNPRPVNASPPKTSTSQPSSQCFSPCTLR